MNSLRTEGRLRLYEDLFLTLLDPPPGAVDQTGGVILTPEQAAHPMFRETVDMFRQAEITVAEQTRWQLARAHSRKNAGGLLGRAAPGLGRTRFGPTVRKKNSSFLGTIEAEMLLKTKEVEMMAAEQYRTEFAGDWANAVRPYGAQEVFLLK